MSAIVYGALRSAVQFGWVWLVGVVPVLGGVPASRAEWLVDTIAGAIMAGVFVAGVRWLETRKGDSLGARVARRVGALLMLGLSGKQPVYAPADAARSAEAVIVTGANLTKARPTGIVDVLK